MAPQNFIPACAQRVLVAALLTATGKMPTGFSSEIQGNHCSGQCKGGGGGAAELVVGQTVLSFVLLLQFLFQMREVECGCLGLGVD